MATFDNKIWLLKRIRDAFVATDDTGLCEIVMIGEDFSKVFQAKALDERERVRDERLCQPSTSRWRDGIGNISEDEEKEIVTQFDTYPQLEDSEEDDLLSGSYIRYDEIGGHRQRSNTAQWLEKKEEALKKAAKIKVIKWDDTSTELTEDLIAEEFTKIEFKKPCKQKSKLADQLVNCPEMPHRHFMEYAKYDGTAQIGFPTKVFKIFMSMLSEEHQNYPLVVCIMASALIRDLIGLICYKYSIEHPEMKFADIDEYGLCIAEDDGEVDWAFPCLDANEPCSKFGFTCLGLVDLKCKNELIQATSSLPDDGFGFAGFHMFYKGTDSEGSHHNLSRHNTGGSATSEAVKSALEAVGEGLYKRNDRERDKLHKIATEAPQYKTYRVYSLRKFRPNKLVQLGISLDKIEVEPLTANKHYFMSKSKYFLHTIDTIAWCQMLEAKSSKCVFRIVYTGKQAASPNRNTSSFFQPNNEYKFHVFESDHATAKEIVEKINTILEMRNSPCRREYKEKKLQPRRSFHSRHMTGS
ncbi:hypothetical protein MSG28_000177 [Choristoneura fumiferana]|uniref:Uncharacterized protein n=1 Tax=Choristoneura fumiferana TaxID=7141 RepID=A0ACC0JZG5_CHOFU|nr:hypothetical protein MSG28_000177 [Choristoneura fumiferana]